MKIYEVRGENLIWDWSEGFYRYEQRAYEELDKIREKLAGSGEYYYIKEHDVLD